jgi:hypothetical protein
MYQAAQYRLGSRFRLSLVNKKVDRRSRAAARRFETSVPAAFLAEDM